jgi:hypothetical protein
MGVSEALARRITRWAAGIAGNTRRTGEDGQDCFVDCLDLARLHDVAREERNDEQHNQYRERP